MSATPRVKIPYPAENDNPFYDVFQSGMLAIDASLYAAREDRNLLMMRGGVLAFNASTGVFSWGSPIELLSPLTGVHLFLDAASVTVADGQGIVVTLVRSPLTSQSLVVTVADRVRSEPLGDDQLLIGYRYLNRLYFRNGKTLNDGDSVALFELTGTGGGGGGGSLPTFTNVSSSTYTVLTTDQWVLVTPPIGGSVLTLPTGVASGTEFVVKDNAGTAASRNISVLGGVHDIDGLSGITIALNWGGARFMWNGVRFNVSP